MLYQVDSAQAVSHLQLTILASTIKQAATAEILSNNFPYISNFPLREA